VLLIWRRRQHNEAGRFSAVVIFYAAVVVADGKALHDKACMQCHATLVGGSGNAVYNKLESRITSFKRLQGQVASCVLAADVMWLPEEQR
jgi:mono/diheme cytochrome c family protein